MVLHFSPVCQNHNYSVGVSYRGIIKNIVKQWQTCKPFLHSSVFSKKSNVTIIHKSTFKLHFKKVTLLTFIDMDFVLFTALSLIYTSKVMPAASQQTAFHLIRQHTSGPLYQQLLC
jgi:hypothetical protein